MSKQSGGILSRFKPMIQRNRLGELMVLKGLLTPVQLHHALAFQRSAGGPLGTILMQQRMITRQALYNALVQQWMIRSLAAITALFLMFAAFGPRAARAGTIIPDVPAQMSLVGAANNAFSHVQSYPSLFHSAERKSDRLDAFVKWTGMFSRFQTAMSQGRNKPVMTAWENGIRPFAGQPLEQMASNVNEFVNRQRYITDKDNWNVSDYWETPVEFFQRGGDCEDFAIAKYVSMRALGVPEDRMRIAIVHDEIKNMPHAVLILYSDRGAMILDNQVKDVRYTANVDRYRPIFTINRTAWWLHTAPGSTVLASAN